MTIQIFQKCHRFSKRVFFFRHDDHCSISSILGHNQRPLRGFNLLKLPDYQKLMILLSEMKGDIKRNCQHYQCSIRNIKHFWTIKLEAGVFVFQQGFVKSCNQTISQHKKGDGYHVKDGQLCYVREMATMSKMGNYVKYVRWLPMSKMGNYVKYVRWLPCQRWATMLHTWDGYHVKDG